MIRYDTCRITSVAQKIKLNRRQKRFIQTDSRYVPSQGKLEMKKRREIVYARKAEWKLG